MRRLFITLLIISLLFISCSRSSFTVSGVSFDKSEDNLILKAYLDQGDEDEKYSFILTSPDKDLVWKGDFTSNKTRLTSEPLLITPGASMPEGEYSVVIHSTNGSEITDTVAL
ncbi:MAG: hypothetical protein ACI4SL_00600 [Candidatus Ornithospirochaeta sp.]